MLLILARGGRSLRRRGGEGCCWALGAGSSRQSAELRLLALYPNDPLLAASPPLFSSRAPCTSLLCWVGRPRRARRVSLHTACTAATTTLAPPPPPMATLCRQNACVLAPALATISKRILDLCRPGWWWKL